MARKSVARKKRKVSTQKKQKKVRQMEFADIPECQDLSYAVNEYKTSREEKIWDPNVDVGGWYPGFHLLARAALASKQQREGIPIIEALETSCSGVAEQYISDVLHESEYVPYKALRMICMKDIPQKFIDKWKPEEMKLFTKGIMKYGKNFSIIRRKLLPHKRVGEFAEFYYVWKRSSMAEAWRKARAIVKAKEKEKEEKRSKKRTNKSPSNLPNNEPVCNLPNNEPVCNLPNNEPLRNVVDNERLVNLSSNRIMTRRATAAMIASLRNGKENDDDSKSSRLTSPSEKYETSSAVESTDSSMEHVQEAEYHLFETAASEKSPTKNEQMSDNSMQRRHKRKSSIPYKIVNWEEESEDETEEIKCVPASIIPQWKRQRRCEYVV